MAQPTANPPGSGSIHPNQSEKRSVGGMKEDATSSKVAHTLTACCRCRNRKTRCDATLPRCMPCERNNTHCEYFDTTKGIKIPRSYVIHLQRKVQALEEELRGLSQEEYECPNADVMARSAGYVRFNENDESRYLGPSSGIAITRLVMELAKQNTDSKSIKEIVPDVKARQIKDRFRKEEGNAFSKDYPITSQDAAPWLPMRSLTDHLVQTFNQRAQANLPTLHEPKFYKVVDDVYQGSTNPYKNFTLRMVIAISMQKLHTRYAGLGDSYYLAALRYLEGAVKPMDLGTLQCFALIAQYSLLTPTRTAAYWVVGLASRLAQQLGITEEATVIPPAHHDVRLDAIEIDMRRRLFWVITSMEFGLAHSLGRPSAFGTTYDHIDVGFFATVDDQYITPTGVMPGSPQSTKKLIAIHFFRMRLLQAEIRRKLYLRKRPEPNSDQDPWFLEMEEKLKHWRNSGPKYDQGSGLNDEWFEGRLNTMIVFLYRPSPQVPKPTAKAARKCFEASTWNIYMQREQIRTSSVDLTWIFTQSLFMALNAILWSLSYPEIRQEYPRTRVEKDISEAQQAMFLASQRWPGVESALELYQNLIAACLKAYDGNSETSYVIDSSSSKTSPASLQETLTPPMATSAFESVGSPRQKQEPPRSSPSWSQSEERVPYLSPTLTNHSTSESGLSNSFQSGVTPPPPDYQYVVNQSTSFDPRSSSYDPQSLFNPFPQVFDTFQSFPCPNNGHGQYLGSMGEQYSQYFHAPYVPQQPFPSLGQEQWPDLMKTLENQPTDWG